MSSKRLGCVGATETPTKYNLLKLMSLQKNLRMGHF
jgi:hypothetical protein